MSSVSLILIPVEEACFLPRRIIFAFFGCSFPLHVYKYSMHLSKHFSRSKPFQRNSRDHSLDLGWILTLIHLFSRSSDFCGQLSRYKLKIAFFSVYMKLAKLLSMAKKLNMPLQTSIFLDYGLYYIQGKNNHK